MKKKTLLKVALLGFVALLAGCNGNNGGPKEPELPTPSKVDPSKYETSYRSMRTLGGIYSHENFSTYQTESGGTAQRVGDVGALVVPVEFVDCKAETLPLGREGSREQINAAVFGDGTGTAGESLKSFYQKSSFGVCNVVGQTLDWFCVDEQYASFARRFGTSGAGEILNRLQRLYGKGGEKEGELDLTQFDKNGDGYIDSLIMIYTPEITTTGELWWAFCSEGGATATDPQDPQFSRFFWASYYFFFEDYTDDSGKTHVVTKQEIIDGTAKPDTHTLCHEFGHVLSLPDYYVTDYNNADYSAMGGLDMMDYNIGDHNAASKSFYGWIDPYVVTETSRITIRSTTDTGDFVIIPINGQYKNTLMDQYLLIEYLTPTGVNKEDGIHPYLGHYPKYFSTAGIRVLHVDARLGKWVYDNGWRFSNFSSRAKGAAPDYYVRPACSNTATDSCFAKYKFLEILPSDGRSVKLHNSKVDDSCLFQEGANFGVNVWQDFKMNGTDGTQTVDLGFTFSIDSITEEGATLTFTKTA